MDALLQDLRYAVRQLSKSPAFAAIAVLTLALGIGANTAIFSAVNTVLLRPLPYYQSDRLLEVVSAGAGEPRFGVSYPDLLDLRGLTGAFSGVAAYTTQRYNLAGAGDPREVQAAQVTADLLQVLGIRPALGRMFTAAEERDQVVVLSDGLWAASFGRDEAIVGKSLSLDGMRFTVIGVMPRGFHFPSDEFQVWTPIGGVFAEEPQAETNRGFHAFNAIARLAPAVSLERARTDVDLLARRIAAESQSDTVRVEARAIGPGPREPGGPGGPQLRGGERGALAEGGFIVTPLHDVAIGDVGPRLMVLLGAVGLVLLIACANAANLLLARATARRREMAVRRALGASRSRLVRQLLAESVLLALVASALGLVFSVWGLDALLALWPGALPRSSEIGLDARILVFTLGLAVITGVGFGLVPALRASAPGVEEALRADAAGGTGGRQRRRLQGILVTGELSLALVLLTGAGLLIRSFISLNRVDPGYDTRDVLAARVRLTPARYATGALQTEFFRTVLASLAGQPGVASASLTRTMPLSGDARILGFDPHGIRPDYPEPFMIARMSSVTPDYFATLGIPIRHGRAFTADDRAGAPPVAIINERLARTLWPGTSPIGRQFPVGGPRRPGFTVTIVGTISDLKSDALDQRETMAELYFPALQEPELAEMWVIVRASLGSPLKLVRAIRDAVRRADPQQPIGDIVTLEQLIGRQTAARRFNTTLLGIFALLALGLALAGIYGVTGYAVAQRRREMGIRIALGARPADVVGLLLGESLRRVAVGVVLGLLGAVAATQALKTMLFGVEPADVATLAGTSALLVGVALLATWLPARRATRVDPMVALRTE